MCIRDRPYIVWLHEDIDRKHIHIVSVRINEKGEKIDQMCIRDRRGAAFLVHSVTADAVVFHFLLHFPDQVQQIQIGQGSVSECFPALA